MHPRIDENHSEASSIMSSLRKNKADLITHDYVFVETTALVQNRLGTKALGRFYREFWPVVQCREVTPDQRQRAMEFVLGRNNTSVSLVGSSHGC